MHSHTSAAIGVRDQLLPPLTPTRFPGCLLHVLLHNLPISKQLSFSETLQPSSPKLVQFVPTSTTEYKSYLVVSLSASTFVCLSTLKGKAVLSNHVHNADLALLPSTPGNQIIVQMINWLCTTVAAATAFHCAHLFVHLQEHLGNLSTVLFLRRCPASMHICCCRQEKERERDNCSLH